MNCNSTLSQRLKQFVVRDLAPRLITDLLKRRQLWVLVFISINFTHCIEVQVYKMEALLIKLSSALGAIEQFQSIGKALDQAELEVSFANLASADTCESCRVKNWMLWHSLNLPDHFNHCRILISLRLLNGLTQLTS